MLVSKFKACLRKTLSHTSQKHMLLYRDGRERIGTALNVK